MTVIPIICLPVMLLMLMIKPEIFAGREKASEPSVVPFSPIRCLVGLQINIHGRSIYLQTFFVINQRDIDELRTFPTP